MKFQNDYGYFTDDGKEYVITRPDTPKPWVNVISNGSWAFVVSQSGSGFSWWENSNLARITRWEQDLVRDEWGKYIYVKDTESGDHWSLGWKPVCRQFEEYECRHGLGYTVLSAKYRGISSAVTMFAPRGEQLELWKVSLKNGSDTARSLSLFTYFEWLLGNKDDTHREFHRTFIGTEYEKGLHALYGIKRKQLMLEGQIISEWPCEAFFASSVEPEYYEGDKDNFIGMYRTMADPAAVEKGVLTNTTGRWNDSIASLQVNVELGPGESKDVVFMLGMSQGKAKDAKAIGKYSNVKNVDAALSEVKKFWEEMLSGLIIKTPDDAMNIMTNTWLKYQAISGRIWGRCAYYQSSGAYGFRDQLQDSQIFLPLDTSLTKKQILLHAAHQFKDGTVYHWWHTLAEWGPRTKKVDDLLWLVFVTLSYIEETADFGILKEKVKFVDGGAATLLEHCERSLKKVLSRFSKRGLPLIGEGDWNDGMNFVGVKFKGESVWMAHFFADIIKRWSEEVLSSKSVNNKPAAKKYLKKFGDLKNAINKYAWDGEWYWRATCDDGSLVGSSKCKEGKIFLNAQIWAIIAGTGTEERIKKAMDSCKKYIYRDYGAILLYPAFSEPNQKIGYISRYAAGVRENGGVYTHAATWSVIAESLRKNPELAFDLYSKICPPNRTGDIDHYKAEPYVTPGNSDGPDSANYGRGSWTWYTGSAAWLCRAGTNWLLGVRPVLDGLLIDPCIPKSWGGFEMTRKFRGAVYKITVSDPDHVSHGVKEIKVDGKKLNGKIIPPFKDKKAHLVEVLLGRR
ncbi:MAG: glycosyl transferase family 36 [Candidatus Omnitrophota bacterium]|jgi:cellobiose phosphorylase